MALEENNKDGHWFTVVVGWMHRNFLWLLMLSYVLAVFMPEPARLIRSLTFGQSAGSDITAPMILLALLLFCAASVVQWSQVRSLMQKPGILLVALLFVWVVPGLYISLLSRALPFAIGESASVGLMVGLALIAAMPVANSSVAWTQSARGNVALGLGLIIVTIVLSPLATPQMLKLMGFLLSPEETKQTEELVVRFSGVFFIIWVILPSAAGLTYNRIVGVEAIEKQRGLIRLVSSVSLLTLNYTNASLAVTDSSEIFSSESLKAILFAVVLAVSLSALGVLSAWVTSRLFRLDRPSLVSLIFGFSMKHNGLALVLAGEVLRDQPRAILMILAATLTQHFVAGIVDRLLELVAKPATSERK